MSNEKVEGLVGSHMTPLLINRLLEPTGNQQARVNMFSDLGGENSGQKKRYPRVNQRRCGKPMVSLGKNLLQMVDFPHLC